MIDKTDILNKNTEYSPPVIKSGLPSIPITSPYTPEIGSIQDDIEAVLESGMLTNSRNVQKFESTMASYLEVDEAVAVSNCTTGLIMTMSVLGLSGEVLVPSFTFSATGHVCFWAGLKPVFVDCDRRDWTIRLSDCLDMVGPRTSAVLAVHTFGNPADIFALEQFAADNDLVLMFEAAHAVGSEYRGRKLGGAGTASVFSLTPTKIITSGEGGIIATNDRALARELRIFRNYGDDGGYDCKRIGLNGRMSEMNAILGLATLKNAENEVKTRNQYAEIYREELSGVPGVIFQQIDPRSRSSFKDFTVVINSAEFGATRDDLSSALETLNIASKKYFDPPLHRQTAYQSREFRFSNVKTTDFLSKNALTLPMYSGMGTGAISHICEQIRNIQRERNSIVEASLTV